jgi:hypothetical protein
MGYNTGVLLLNDHIDDIWKNPKEFAQNLKEAYYLHQRTQKPEDFKVGCCVNGGTVFHCGHADTTGVYAIGGNHTTRMFFGMNGGKHYSNEEQVEILKTMADSLGYRISKKLKN